jgi:alkylhydroperoxidase family enzyme
VVQKLAKSLSPAQLVTLAAACGLANWTNRFNESFAVELP